MCQLLRGTGTFNLIHIAITLSNWCTLDTAHMYHHCHLYVVCTQLITSLLNHTMSTSYVPLYAKRTSTASYLQKVTTLKVSKQISWISLKVESMSLQVSLKPHYTKNHNYYIVTFAWSYFRCMVRHIHIHIYIYICIEVWTIGVV